MTDDRYNLVMSSKYQATSSIPGTPAEPVEVRVYPNGQTESEKASPAFLRRYGKTYSPYGNLTPDLRKYGKTYSGRVNLKQESSSDHSSQNESEKPVVGHGESVSVENSATTQASTTDAKSHTLNKVSGKNDSTCLKNVTIEDRGSKLGDGSSGQNINELATQNIKLPCDKPSKKMILLNDSSIEKNDLTCSKKVIIKDHASSSKSGIGSKERNIIELATKTMCDKPAKKMIVLNDSGSGKPVVLYLVPNSEATSSSSSSSSVSNSTNKDNTNAAGGKAQLKYLPVDKYHGPSGSIILLDRTMSSSVGLVQKDLASQRKNTVSISAGKGDNLMNTPGGKVPLINTPGGKVPLINTPGGKVPLINTPGGKVPLINTPGGKVPLINTPGGKVPLIYQPIKVDKNRAPGGSIILVDQSRSGSVNIVQKAPASQGKTSFPVSAGKEDSQINTVANEKPNSDTLDLQSQKSAKGSLKQLKEKDISAGTVSKKRVQTDAGYHPNTVDPQLQNYVLDVPKSRDNSLNEKMGKKSPPSKETSVLDVSTNASKILEPKEKSVLKHNVKRSIKSSKVSQSNSTESDSVPCKKVKRSSNATKEISVKTDSNQDFSELGNSNSCPKLGVLDDTKSTSKENDNSTKFSHSSRPLKNKSIGSESDTIVKKMKKKKKEKEKQVTKKVKKRKLKPIATGPTGVVDLNAAPSLVDDNGNVKKIPKKKKNLEQKKLLKKKKLLESQNKGKLEKQMKKVSKKKVKISDPISSDIAKDGNKTGSSPLPKLEKYLSVVPKEQKSAIETCEKVDSDGMPILEDATKIIPLHGDVFQTMPILQELEKTCPLMASSPYKSEEMVRNLSPQEKKKAESSTKTKKMKFSTDKEKIKLSNVIDTKKPKPFNLSTDSKKERPKLSTDTNIEKPKLSKLLTDTESSQALKLSPDTNLEKPKMSKLSTEIKMEKHKLSVPSVIGKEESNSTIDKNMVVPNMLKLSNDTYIDNPELSKSSADTNRTKPKLSSCSTDTEKINLLNDSSKEKLELLKLSTDTKKEKPKSKLSKLSTDTNKETAKLSKSLTETKTEKAKLSTDNNKEMPKLSTKAEKPKSKSPKLSTDNGKEKIKLSKSLTETKKEKPKLSTDTNKEKPKLSTDTNKEKAKLSKSSAEKAKLPTDNNKETSKLSKSLVANDIVSFQQRNLLSEGDNLKCSHSNSATEVKGEKSALINVLKFGKTLEKSPKSDNTLDPPQTTENEISYSAMLTHLSQLENRTLSSTSSIHLNTKQIHQISALDASAGTTSPQKSMQTPVSPVVNVSSAMTSTPQNSTLTTSGSQDTKSDVSSNPTDIPHAICKTPVPNKTENDVMPPTDNVPPDVLTNRQYSAADISTKDSAIPSKSPSDSFSAISASGDATLATAEMDDDSSNLHLYLSPEHREESSNFDLLPHSEHNLDPKPRKLCQKHKEKLTKCRKKTDGESSCTNTPSKCKNCSSTDTNKCLACYSCQKSSLTKSELSKKEYQSPGRNLPSEKCYDTGEINTPDQLSCNVCLCSFTNRSDLEVHMKCHLETKLPESSLLGKKIHQEKGLRWHIGERSYQCSYCQTGFSSKGILRVHVRSHTGEKPFKCPVCPSQFAESGCLAVHLADHQTKNSQSSSLLEIENLDSLPSQPQNEKDDICDSEETRLPSTSSATLCSSASESAKALAITRQEKRQSRMRMLQTYLAGEDAVNIDQANKVVPTCESQDPVSTVAPKLVENHKDSVKQAPSPAAEPVSLSLSQINIESRTMASENDHKANEVDMNLKVGRSFSLGIKDYQAIGSVKQEVPEPNASKIDHIKTDTTTEMAPSGQELLLSDLPPPLLSPQNVSPVTHGDKTSALLLKMEDPPLLPKVLSLLNPKNQTSGTSTPDIGGTLSNLIKEPVSASVPILSQNHEIGTTPSAVDNTVNEVFIKKEVIEEQDRKEWESLEKPDDITSNTFHEQERVIFLPTGGQNSSSHSMQIVDWPRTIVQCSVEEQPDDVNKIQQAKSSHGQSLGTWSSEKKSNKMDCKMKTNDISKKRKLSVEDENLGSCKYRNWKESNISLTSPSSPNEAKKHCADSKNVQPTVEIEVLSEDPVEVKQEIDSSIDGISNTSKSDNVSPLKSISSDQESLDEESQKVKKDSYGMSKRNLSRLPSEPIRHLPKRNYKKPQKYFCDDFDYSISLNPMKSKTSSNPVSGVTPTMTDNSSVTVSSSSQSQSVSCESFEKNSSRQIDKSNENCKQSDKTNATNKKINDNVNNNNKTNDKTKKSDNSKKNDDVDEKNKNDSKSPKKKSNSNSPTKESTPESASADDTSSTQKTRRRYDMTKRLLKKEMMDREKELQSREAVSKNFLRLRFNMPESAGEFEQYHKKKLLKNATVKKHTVIPKTAKARKSPRTSPKKCSESHYGLAKMAQADQRPFLSVVPSERKILPGPRPKTQREEILENLMSYSSANFVANYDAISNLKQNNSDELDVRTEPTHLSKLLGTPLAILPSGAAPQPPLNHPITTVASNCKNSSVKTIAAFIPVTLSATPKNMPIPVTVLANPLNSVSNQQNNQFFMGNFPAHPQDGNVPAPLPEDTVLVPLPEKTEPAPLPEETVPAPLLDTAMPVPLPVENSVTTPLPQNAVPTLLLENAMLTPLPTNNVPTPLPEDTVLDQKPVISQLLPLPEIKPTTEPIENIYPIPVLQIKKEVTFDDEAYGCKQSDGLSGLRITGVTGGVTTHDTIPTNSDAICTTAMLAKSHEADSDEGTPQDWSVTRRRPLRCTLVQTEDGLGRSEFTFECCGLSFSEILKLASHLDSCHK